MTDDEAEQKARDAWVEDCAKYGHDVGNTHGAFADGFAAGLAHARKEADSARVFELKEANAKLIAYSRALERVAKAAPGQFQYWPGGNDQKALELRNALDQLKNFTVGDPGSEATPAKSTVSGSERRSVSESNPPQPGRGSACEPDTRKPEPVTAGRDQHLSGPERGSTAVPGSCPELKPDQQPSPVRKGGDAIARDTGDSLAPLLARECQRLRARLAVVEELANGWAQRAIGGLRYVELSSVAVELREVLTASASTPGSQTRE